MRLLIILTLLFYFDYKVQAQFIDSTNTRQTREFKNQGEQEDYWAEKLFKEKYSKQKFIRYTGKISIVDKNTFKFDSGILEVSCKNEELKSIFALGIFYPQLISTDTVRIGNFEEAIFLSTDPTIKRFRFWLFRKQFINPQVYFIELINPSADKTTDINTFIKGASLTFVKDGWIII